VADDTNPAAGSSGRGADLRTFLIADIRGYTRFTRDHGDEAASSLAAWFAAVVRGVMSAFDGELLELRGDEALCVFSSARQALRAAVAVQRHLRVPVDGEDVFPLGVGIGLDAGEAVPTEGGFRGSALNLAARLCGHARGGEVLATERLVGLTGPVSGLHWERPRAVRLKGVRDRERIVLIKPDDAIPPPPPPPPEPASRRSRRTILLAGTVAVLVVGAVVLAFSQRDGSAGSVTSVPVLAQSVAAIDPHQHRVVADVRLPAPPESMVAGSGQVWVGGTNQTLTPVALGKPRAGEPIGLGIDPAELAYGDGSVWVFDAASRLAQVDARQQSPVGVTHRLWRCRVVSGFLTKGTQCAAQGLAAVGNEVWVGNDSGLPVANGVIDRIDANSTDLRVVGLIHGVHVGLLAAGQGQVWLWGDVGRTAYGISVARHRVVQRTDLGVAASYAGGGIAIGSGYAWIVAPASGTLFGIAPGLGVTPATHQYRVPRGVTCVATGDGSIWLGVGDGRVLKVNPFTGQRTTYRLGHAPVAITYSAGRVWVALA
jgi:class 3 adenylate cyclase